MEQRRAAARTSLRATMPTTGAESSLVVTPTVQHKPRRGKAKQEAERAERRGGQTPDLASAEYFGTAGLPPELLGELSIARVELVISSNNLCLRDFWRQRRFGSDIDWPLSNLSHRSQAPAGAKQDMAHDPQGSLAEGEGKAWSIFHFKREDQTQDPEICGLDGRPQHAAGNGALAAPADVDRKREPNSGSMFITVLSRSQSTSNRPAYPLLTGSTTTLHWAK